jgi:putative tRNA adenosine deaminase-associated protein
LLVVTYSAVALVRFGTGGDATWAGDEVDLEPELVADLDALVDSLDPVIERCALSCGEAPQDATGTLVLLEEDDEWLGVLRVQDLDVRVFISDRRAVLTSELAERFFADAVGVDPVGVSDVAGLLTDDLDLPAAPDTGTSEPLDSDRPRIEPAGDAELLSDLGTSAAELLALSNAGGRLPADVLTAIADAAGAGEVLEELRGG